MKLRRSSGLRWGGGRRRIRRGCMWTREFVYIYMRWPAQNIDALRLCGSYNQGRRIHREERDSSWLNHDQPWDLQLYQRTADIKTLYTVHGTEFGGSLLMISKSNQVNTYP